MLLALGGGGAEGGYKSRLAKHRQQKDSVEGFASGSRGVTIGKQSRATTWVPVTGATP